MPTTMMPQQEAARLFLQNLHWEVQMWNLTSEILTNITKALNVTMCNVQMIHMKLQQERFIRAVTTSNVYEWRRLWNVSNDLWLQVHPGKTICNDTACSGFWVQYNVTKSVPICHYYVLPVILPSGYWLLKTKGDWFSPRTNLTYDLKACDLTDRGVACLTTSRYHDPCLINDTALCEWYVEQPRDMLWQVGPHTICVATVNSHPLLPQIPYSGCIRDVYIWHWANQTYKLTNYSTETHLSMVQ